MTDSGVKLCAIFRVPADGLVSFLAYENAVLPLLAEHGGVLRQQLRSKDARREIHVIWFPSEAAFAAYRDDPRRAKQAGLFKASGAEVELLSVVDVG
jgi:hypothetical protein